MGCYAAGRRNWSHLGVLLLTAGEGSVKAENTTPDRPADISVFRSGHSAGSERRRLAAYKATVSKRNKEPKVKFLRYCRKYATVVSACDAVGVRTSTFYQWKRDDPVFAGQVKAGLDPVS